MSLITEIVNVTEISYWCLYLAVIMNIVLTSFWCYIPKLAYISALETSKCDHFDVTSQLTVTKTSFWCLYSTVHINVTKTSKWYQYRIVIVRLQKFDLMHHFDIILMWHTNTHEYEYIMNFKMWSFWCHLKQTLSMSLKYHIDVSIQLWLRTSSWHHFDVTYQY